MLVRMKTRFTGTRNMQEWPGIGETIDVPEAEAERMIHAGHAEEATDATSADDSDTEALEDGDSAAPSADGDTQADEDGDVEQEGVVDGDATKPTGTRAKRVTKRR